MAGGPPRTFLQESRLARLGCCLCVLLLFLLLLLLLLLLWLRLLWLLLRLLLLLLLWLPLLLLLLLLGFVLGVGAWVLLCLCVCACVGPAVRSCFGLLCCVLRWGWGVELVCPVCGGVGAGRVFSFFVVCVRGCVCYTFSGFSTQSLLLASGWGLSLMCSCLSVWGGGSIDRLTTPCPCRRAHPQAAAADSAQGAAGSGQRLG
jgi:hypothetical protein